MTTLKPLPLGIVILTHRYDDAFLACLESAQLAEEVIVVAYQLEANWSELKKKYHFKLTTKDHLITDFAAERNQALKLVTQPWVFFLDSDEVLNHTQINSLAEYVQQNKWSGVYVKRQDYFYGKPLKGGEVGNAYFLRLARTSEMKFSRDVHEVAEVKGLTTHSAITLEHYPHPTISLFFKSVSGYAFQEAQYRLKHHQNFSIVELLFWPTAKFIWNYFFKLGLIDGWRGLIYATLMSLHSLAVRIYLFELSHHVKK